jgi:hypothetical protein
VIVRAFDRAVRVFWRLLLFADRTGHCDQSVGTIAKGLGLARSTVQSRINELIRLVYGRKFSQTHSDSAQAASRYRGGPPVVKDRSGS